MKKHLALLSLLLLAMVCKAQTAPDKYWVQFNDKDASPYSVENPEAFLSQKALERRDAIGVAIETRDLPVDPVYISQVLELDTGITLVNSSKWFNAITIHTTDSTLINTIAALPFVHLTKSVHTIPLDPKTEEFGFVKAQIHNETLYGPSFRQIEMLGGHLLHEMGFHGEGIDIAVLDAGWIDLYNLPVFDKLHNENRLKATRDFVAGGTAVQFYHDHGMYVLSTLAGWMPDSLIGTAYGANYYLFRTEDVGYENVVEEDNWVAAIEHADSLGVDVVNTSLGYSLFDDSLANYSYADMNGNTTRITQAADWAAQRGMLLVNSAGNSGNSPWHYITAPADADSILTVGAVKSDRTKAEFSSFGPTSDGRIKPDVMAMGQASVIADHDGGVRTGSGTSFSSPILCGLTACLWQAHPDKSNMEIIDAIRRSASLYQAPTDGMGYGIPNFWVAHQILSSNLEASNPLNFNVFPNPFSHEITLSFEVLDPESVEVQMFDATGRELDISFEFVSHNQVKVRMLDNTFQKKPSAVYLIKLFADGKNAVQQVVNVKVL